MTPEEYTIKTGRRLPDLRIDALQRIYAESLEYYQLGRDAKSDD